MFVKEGVGILQNSHCNSVPIQYKLQNDFLFDEKALILNSMLEANNHCLFKKLFIFACTVLKIIGNFNCYFI